MPLLPHLPSPALLWGGLSWGVLVLAPVALRVPVVGLGGELEQALAGLSDSDAAARSDAERTLAGLLGPADRAAVAEAALAGDAEVRRRLARAVGARDANLSLAASLLTEPEPALVELGEHAVAEVALRWHGDLGAPPLHGTSLWRALERRRDEAAPELLFLLVDAPLVELVDRLARLARVPVGLTLDPELALLGAPLQPGAPAFVGGTWDEVLSRLAAAFGVEAFGFGLSPGERAAGSPEPYVSLRRSTAQPGGIPESRGAVDGPTGLTDLTNWCALAVAGQRGAERRAAALALSGSGWPAGLGLLEQRVRGADDGAALDGLLLAAARGRLAPVLLSPEPLRALAAQADLGFDRLGTGSTPIPLPRAEAVLRATSRLPTRGTGGEDLVAVLLEGFAAASPRGQWWRLCALEGIAPRGGDARVAARGVLLDAPGTHAPALLFQALRALVAMGGEGGGPPLAGAKIDLAGLLRAPEREDDYRELAALLAASGAPLPAGLTEPGADAALPGPPLPRGLLLVEWALARGALDAAAARLFELPGVAAGFPPLAPPASPSWPPQAACWQQDAIAAVLAEWVQAGETPSVRLVLSRAQERAGFGTAAAEGLARIAVLAGAPAPGEGEGGAAALHQLALERGGSDALALAGLAGTPRWAEAQEALLTLVASALSGGVPLLEVDVVQLALVRAESELRAASLDSAAEELRAGVWRIAMANKEDPRYVRFLVPWQDPPRLRLAPLGRRERTLDPDLPRDPRDSEGRTHAGD